MSQNVQYLPILSPPQHSKHRTLSTRQETNDIIRISNPRHRTLGKPSLYRYEYDGILIYDSKARIAGSGRLISRANYQPLLRNDQSDDIQEQIENASISDQNQFLRMKQFTPFPQFQYEYTIEVPQDASNLQFDSRFESGNLWKAIKVSATEYNLVLQSDTGTKSCSQWYYFSVINPRSTQIRFNIVNFYKSTSSYCNGMNPVVWSQKQYEANGIGWQRGGTDVSYYQNQWKKVGQNKQGLAYEDGHYYTLSFTYKFQAADDKVWFAYSFPYTVTKFFDYLDRIQEKSKDTLRVNNICTSLAGNLCKMLTITNDIGSYISNDEEQMTWRLDRQTQKRNKVEIGVQHKSKRAIVITSRVHPGETISSYIIEGFIDFISGDDPTAVQLRDNFVFKIVPMLNPDGVRYGNYRYSLLGVDLNRRWQFPNEKMHPTIYYTKKMIQTLREIHEVSFFCDIHGHSSKNNIFMYGNTIKACDSFDLRKNLISKAVPYIMSKQCKHFQYSHCKFSIEKSKESTARVVFYKEGIINSYTLESSFYKSDANQEQFTIDDYKLIGIQLGKLCGQFISMEKFNRNLNLIQKAISVPRSQSPIKCQRIDDIQQVVQEEDIFTDYERKSLFNMHEHTQQKQLIMLNTRIIHSRSVQQQSNGSRNSDSTLQDLTYIKSRDQAQKKILVSRLTQKSPKLVYTNIVNFKFQENASQKPISINKNKFFQVSNAWSITSSKGETNPQTETRFAPMYSEKSLRHQLKSQMGNMQPRYGRSANHQNYQREKSYMRKFWSRENLKSRFRKQVHQNSTNQTVNEIVQFWQNIQSQVTKIHPKDLAVFGENPHSRRLPNLK